MNIEDKPIVLKEELLNAIESEIYSVLPRQLQMAEKCTTIAEKYAMDFTNWSNTNYYKIPLFGGWKPVFYDIENTYLSTHELLDIYKNLGTDAPNLTDTDIPEIDIDFTFEELIENHIKEIDESKILGMTKEDGINYCTNMDYIVAVTRVDDTRYLVTMDLRFDRVNLEIDNGIITKFSIG
jgi:hypothetical protein